MKRPTRAWDSNRFNADRDVDAVAEYFVFVGDHIPHVDAHTELHHPVCREMVVPFLHQACIAIADSIASTMLENSTRNRRRCSYQPAALIEDDRVYRASMALNVACVPASSAPIIRE